MSKLAATIFEETSRLEHYCTEHDVPSPSFDQKVASVALLPAELQTSRQAIIEASVELAELLRHPMELVMHQHVSS